MNISFVHDESEQNCMSIQHFFCFFLCTHVVHIGIEKFIGHMSPDAHQTINLISLVFELFSTSTLGVSVSYWCLIGSALDCWATGRASDLVPGA